MLICGVFYFKLKEKMINSARMPLYPFYFILYPFLVFPKILLVVEYRVFYPFRFF